MKSKARKKYRIAGTIIKRIRESISRPPIPPSQRHLQIRTPHLTQQEVAQQISMDESTLSKIERGMLKIELDFIEQLTRILQLTPLQQSLLLAASNMFAVALTNYLGLPPHLQDSFRDINVDEKSLAELETFTQQKLHEGCLAIYPRLIAELGEGDSLWVSSLHELNSLLNSGHRYQLDYILGTVAALITKVIQASSCSIYLFDGGQKPHKLIMRATTDCHLAHHPPVLTLNDESIVGKAAKEGQTLIVSDPSADSYHIIMPVLAFRPRHRLFGVISATTAHMFSTHEIQFLELVCGLLATTYRM